MTPALRSTRSCALAAVFALVVLIVAAESWLTIGREREEAREELRGLARATSEALALRIERLAEHGDRAGAARLAATMSRSADLESSVLLDATGGILDGSGLTRNGRILKDEGRAPLGALATEVLATSGFVLRDTRDPPGALAATPVFLGPGANDRGVLLMAFDLGPRFAAEWERAQSNAVLLALIGLLGGGLLWLMLDTRISKPAGRLAGAADRFASGDHSARSGISGRHELGRVGVAFDRMAERIEGAERERALAGALLDAVLKSLPVGVCAMDRETGRVRFANRRWGEVLGIDAVVDPSVSVPEIGEPLRFQYDDGTPCPFEDLPGQRTRVTGQPAEGVNLVVVHPDGSRVPVYALAIPVIEPDGGYDTVLSVIQDRRDLDRVYRELRESEGRFASAAEVTGQVVYERDLATDRARFSGHVSAVLGHGSQDLATLESWNRCVHPEDLPGLRDGLAKAASERTMFDAVYRFRHREGRWLWVRDRAVFRFDQAGLPQSLIGSVADITDQRALEQQLLHAQKMETVGTLAGGIAHDFNNQLTGVIGYLDYVRDRFPGAADMLEPIAQARQAAMRCADLTRGLLAFSRRLVGERHRVVLNEAVAETLELLRRTLPATIHIQSFPGVGLWPASCDVGQIQQVLMNLCVNARDAMPAGGILSVSTRNLAIDGAEAATRGRQARAGEFVEICVSDTGAGIHPDFLPRIFEPFFTTKRVGAGTGLGLAMAYGIASSHEGWIEVESEPGRGSTFRVYLPRADARDEPRPAERAAARTPGRGETVLVVEDETIVRGMVTRVLESSGYRVLAAPDGEKGLEVFGANRGEIGLVLLDLTMPGLPGLTVLARIRELDPAATVILTSGYSQDDAGEFEARGAAGFLAKPYPTARLLDMVRDLLDRRA